MDFKTGGSTRLKVENPQILTTVPIHISGSVTEGLRIGKAGNDYREIQFETNGVDTAFIQVDSSEGMIIGCQSIFDEIIFMTTGGDGTQERMRIEGTGKVGIGTTSSQRELHVSGSDGRIRIEADAGNHPGLELAEAGTRKWIIYNQPNANDNLTFKTNSHDRMVITQSGSVGIGTTSPDTTLHVDGDAILDGQVVIKAANSAIDDDTLSNNNISFYLDEGNNQLKVRVKYSDGTLKTGTIALS